MSTKRKTAKSDDVESKKQKVEKSKDVIDRSMYADLELEAPTIEGEVLFTGCTNWDLIGRKDVPKGTKDLGGVTLWGPHRISTLKDKKFRSIIGSCTACHCVAIDTTGNVYTWGRNDKGQLGHEDTKRRDIPTIVESLKGLNIVTAAVGRNHTLFVTSKGDCYATGDNKCGQLGIGSNGNEINRPTMIDYQGAPVCRVSCGAEFSMFVSVDGRLYATGLPEYGQLGLNSDGKYLAKANKVSFHYENVPTRVPLFIDKAKDGSIIPVPEVHVKDVACGTNHTVMLDKLGRVFTWGFGGYGRLGHSSPKDEFVPRIIQMFNGPNRAAKKIAAGGAFCLATNIHGMLYIWGQNKPTGEAAMYPKPVADLNGWDVRSMGCSVRSIVVAADDSVISWGCSPTSGELGYGPSAAKSSARPQEVKPLNDVYVLEVGCGVGHTLFIARTTEEKDEKAVDALPVYEPSKHD